MNAHAAGRRAIPVHAAPRPGFCASCEIELVGRPVYRLDEAYCCDGCAAGGPCMCTYESDLAEDAVDRIGLPFATPERAVDDGEHALEPRERVA